MTNDRGAAPGVRIAWADEQDIAAIAPLILALYAHDRPDAPRPAGEVAAGHAAQLIDAATPHRLAIAFDATGEAVGLAAVAVFTSVSESRPDRRKQMELKELFVAPAQRGRGIGAALMAWVEAKAVAAGVHRLDWHVRADNDRGIAFYQRLGGKVLDDRLSMRKLLSGD